MDRDITQEVRKRRTVRRIVTVVVAIAAAAFCLAATVEWLRPSLKRRDVQTARVSRGSVEATLQASGAVVPLVEQVVSSPVEARVLRIGRRAGTPVKAGDELLSLDTAATRLEAERLGDRVAQKESENEQLRIRLDETVASLRAQIEQKKLDAEIVHYTATQKQKLREEGLTAEQEALAAQATAKKTDIELRQLHEALRRAELSRQAQLAAARIADLSSYRVVASISDVHASRVGAGMRTHVKIDDESLGGTIESVDPRIENGVMRFYVTLDQPSHARLRNNLRVDVSIVTG